MKVAVEFKNGELVTIKPQWLVDLEKKCKEDEEQMHFLLFSDYENASPIILSHIYTLIRDRKVGNMWELPKNAKIIITENSREQNHDKGITPEETLKSALKSGVTAEKPKKLLQ